MLCSPLYEISCVSFISSDLVGVVLRRQQRIHNGYDFGSASFYGMMLSQCGEALKHSGSLLELNNSDIAAVFIHSEHNSRLVAEAGALISERAELQEAWHISDLTLYLICFSVEQNDVTSNSGVTVGVEANASNDGNLFIING